MANPLKKNTPEQPIGGNTDEEYLRRRCHFLNFDWSWMKDNRWHYVEPRTPEKDAHILIIDGIAAEEVWKVGRGEKLDYVKWPREKLEKIERRCRWLIKRGSLRPEELRPAA